MRVYATKAEVWKMAQFIAPYTLCKGIRATIDAFLGNRTRFRVESFTRNGGWGSNAHSGMYIIDSNNIALTFQDGYRLYLEHDYSDRYELHEKDTRVPAIMALLHRMQNEKMSHGYVKLFTKSYFAGKRPLEEVISAAKKRKVKDDKLHDALKAAGLNTSHVTSDVRRAYNADSKTLEEVLNVAKLQHIKQGGAFQ